jgi:Ca2+-binding RTX toxin-like protein
MSCRRRDERSGYIVTIGPRPRIRQIGNGVSDMSILNGTKAVDVLAGRSGSDNILGKAGNDLITGNEVGGKELLVDGSFESVRQADGTWAARKTVGGWHSDTGIEVWGKGMVGTTPTDGNNVVELDYDKRFSKFWQDVQTEAGKSYDFTFDYSARKGTTLATNAIEVHWNDQLVGHFDPNSPAWQHGALSLTGSGGLDRIEFREVGAANDSLGGLLDSVSLKTAGSGVDTIFGGAGNDAISGLGGDDIIYGSTVPRSGGVHTQLATNADNDFVHGGSGADHIYGNNGDDKLFGDTGNDLVCGGRGDDTLEGGSGDDRLFGDSGNDLILDGSGRDIVEGGSGNDRVIAGAGNDIYRGGSGFDVLDMSDAQTGVKVNLTKHSATGLGKDRVYSFEGVDGSSQSDTLVGSGGNDVLKGAAGNDVLRGHGGNDTLAGGTGSDTFVWKIGDISKQVATGTLTTLTDFSSEDHLDLRDFTRSFGITAASDINEALCVTFDGHNSHLFIKTPNGFAELAVLQNFNGHDAPDMATHGQILL